MSMIDGANMFYPSQERWGGVYAQQKMGWFIDWQKVKKWLEKKYDIQEIKYYTGLKNNDKPMRGFLNKLKSYQYQIVAKPLKKILINDNGKKFVYKANFDVEITYDIMKVDEEVIVIFLFSGDSDFSFLLKELKKQKKKVFVCATKQTLSRELKTASAKYILLEDIKAEIEYKKTPA